MRGSNLNKKRVLRELENYLDGKRSNHIRLWLFLWLTIWFRIVVTRGMDYEADLSVHQCEF
jgi:hypothetical protein